MSDAIYQNFNEAELKPLLEAGVFWGRKKSNIHPKMRQFILNLRNEVAIINLEKTLKKLQEPKEFLKEKPQNRGNILLVATQPFGFKIYELIKDLNVSMVKERWIGGILTNFNVISKRIEFFKKLKQDFESGALDKYTKKEKLKIQNQLIKMEKLFGGLENFNSLPDVVIIIDPAIHKIAVAEANYKKIPVIAFANVDANPNLIDYIVPGNTKSLKSVEWFLGEIKEAILEARKFRDESKNLETSKQNINIEDNNQKNSAGTENLPLSSVEI
jgi:small subunit ribosomal protein S2